MQTREWILTAAVVIVPLIIAVVVTLWSLDQVRYRPRKRRPANVARETSAKRGQDDSVRVSQDGESNRSDVREDERFGHEESGINSVQRR